ncbi:MAG: hypothetical protein LBJ82_00205 [Deltaproteobacteria bacterium]|jgi:hypothetical protein|nr:hypothetical protein [Deltaproteobacteria bacterium]
MKSSRAPLLIKDKVLALFRKARPDFSPQRTPERPVFSGRAASEGTLLERLRLSSAEGGRKGMLFALLISVMSCLALGLILVWLNTERTRLALRAHALQREADARQELRAKLEVEHASLVSPDVLMKRAGILGLRAALPGEIRRMDSALPLEADIGGE